VWSFGDGHGFVQLNPSNTGQSYTSTVHHTYLDPFVGTAVVQAYAIDNLGSVGDLSPAVNFTVVKGVLPPVATIQSPVGTQVFSVEKGTSNFVTVSYLVRSTKDTNGTFVPISGITFNTGDPANPTPHDTADHLDGTYTFNCRYFAAANAGASRTVTATVLATNFIKAGQAGKALHGRFRVPVGIRNPLDMIVGQETLTAFAGDLVNGVDEQHLAPPSLRLAAVEDEQARRDRGRVEEVRRQADQQVHRAGEAVEVASVEHAWELLKAILAVMTEDSPNDVR